MFQKFQNKKQENETSSKKSPGKKQKLENKKQNF